MAATERRLLDWLCARIPPGVSPDHMTALGVAGAVMIFTGYAASRAAPAALWLAVAGYVIHWLGDSMDGSLARFRGGERPAYGYFVDHSIDAFAIALGMIGLGLTHHVRMDVALFTLSGYLVLAIHVFLRNQVLGELRLSFAALGPTELRLGLIAMTLAMMMWNGDLPGLDRLALPGGSTAFDLLTVATGACLYAIALWQFAALAIRLAAPNRDG